MLPAVAKRRRPAPSNLYGLVPSLKVKVGSGGVRYVAPMITARSYFK